MVMRMAIPRRPATVNTPATSPLFEKNPLVAALEAGTSVGRVDVDAAGRTRVDVDCSAGMEVVGNETIGNAAGRRGSGSSDSGY